MSAPAHQARPATLVVVAGTGTEIGKTWCAAALLGALRARGHTVAARKPAQSFEPPPVDTDADLLARATGEQPEQVCPPHRWYEVPMAPPMAADVLGRPPVLAADLVDELRWPDEVDVGLVELAGGVGSPQAEDADGVGVITAVAPDAVLLVADAGLGTIDAVRLATLALASVGDRLVVLLNRFDPTADLHRRNLDWLRDREALDVTTDIDSIADRLSS